MPGDTEAVARKHAHTHRDAHTGTHTHRHQCLVRTHTQSNKQTPLHSCAPGPHVHCARPPLPLTPRQPFFPAGAGLLPVLSAAFPQSSAARCCLLPVLPAGASCDRPLPEATVAEKVARVSSGSFCRSRASPRREGGRRVDARTSNINGSRKCPASRQLCMSSNSRQSSLHRAKNWQERV